jgi:FkbM family methyltransferase
MISQAEFKELSDSLTKELESFYVPEGGSFQVPGEVARLRELVERRKPKSIMEIGFNTGHSALLFLAITPPEVKVVSFDLGEYAHVFVAKRFIDKRFPERHTLVTGDSTNTVPHYEEQVAHRMNSKNPPPLTFDFIFIDGGHQGDIPEKDILNSYRLVTDETNVVAIDDISRDPSRQMHYTIQPTKAWGDMINAGIIREEGYDDYFENGSCPEGCNARGLAWGSYIIPGASTGSTAMSKTNIDNKIDKVRIIQTNIKKLRYSQIQNEYKYMDRAQMVIEIDRLYHREKNYEKLVALSDLYLEYFEDFNKRDTNYIRFYRAGGNFTINTEAAIRQYEEIIDSPAPGPTAEPDEFPDHIRFYSICNVGLLYPKDICSEIPKIIHILFFGETEFYNFHHRCLHSMMQYMPDYEIWIHNSKEPENNKYWNNIKKQKNVKIIKIVVPQHFDGFELKHFQYKADVVRLEVLYNHGGVYLDLDMIIVKPFHEVFQSGHSFYISKERQGHDCLINAFLASKPKNEFLKIWLNAFKSGLRLGIWAHHIRDSNKKLLDDHPHYMHKYKIKLLEGNVFMPLHWQDTEAFLRSETIPYEFPAESYGTHLWETILGDVMKRNLFLNKQKLELAIYNDKTELFHLDCITDRLVISNDYFHDFRNDQFVNEYITKGARNGYFIEIGACDGIECSSCYYFEKNLGWKGLAVEPARIYANNIKKNRANPIFTAVSNVTSSASNGIGNGAIFYENDVTMLSGLKVALENNKSGQDWARIGRKEYVVDTITLYDLCCQQNAPDYIDYCAMDCEGSEYEILETFFKENKLSYIKNTELTTGGDKGEDPQNIGLIVTNKVFHIDMFSIEINDNYKMMKELMENNDYEEIENPFLKIITFNGREITWEKYFKKKHVISPQYSNRTNESSTTSLSTLSSSVDTPHTLNTPPPTSPNTDKDANIDVVIKMPVETISAKFLILPPFAEEIVAICIEERPERTKYVSEHLLSFGLKHTLLLNNMHPTNTKVGCFQSHMKAIQYAYNSNLSSVLIVEDDIVIRENITDLASISLPLENWDILYLGGILTKFDKMDSTNKWVRGTIWCNHAYLVKKHMYKPILDFVNSYPDINELESKNIDYMYTEYIQPKYDCWLANEQYIIQKEGYSEIDCRVKWANQFDWSTFSMKVV